MTLLSPWFFVFLTISAGVYYVSPQKTRPYILSAASILFYLFLGLVSFTFIFVVTFISFFVALKIERKKNSCGALYFSAGVLILLGIWILSRSPSGIVAPIGISFYTLRVISYLADVKRRSVTAERDFLKYLLFTSFFPLAFLGPVAKYSDCKETLLYPNRAAWDNISGGVLRILFGVFKKVVIADALAEPVRKIIAAPDVYFGAYVLILIMLYSAEIYFDFSGGIDIVLGAAKIFGADMPENFNKPFSSKSLAEFWNRWHITLGEWFEHYVFYPISLSKPMQRLSRFTRKRLGVGIGKRIPLYFATLLTWTLTGLWHGGALHFVAWGLVNGILVLCSSETSRIAGTIADRNPSISRFREKLSFLAPVRVFFIIGAVRLLDLYQNTPLTFKMIASIFTRTESYLGIAFKLNGILSFSSILPVILGIFPVLALSKLGISLKKISDRPYAFALCAVVLLTSSLLLGTYGYGYNASDFIYSQF